MSHLIVASTDGDVSLSDYNFDSVSRRSSTVVDSELAAEQVRRDDLRRQFRVPTDQLTTNAINIQIQVQNNGSEVKSVERVNAEQNTKRKVKVGAISRQLKFRIMFSLIILLVIVAIVVTSVWSSYKMKNDSKDDSEETTSLPQTSHETSFKSQNSPEPTSSLLSTTTKDPLALVSRLEWGANSAQKGIKKLQTPVRLLIIMDTQTEACDNLEDCGTFLKDRQKSQFILDSSIKDIKENFLIASDGTVYEGRGFDYEGQHTYDRQSTDYNPNAIGVAFIGNYTRTPVTTRQEAAVHFFIHNCIKLGNISENYNLFHQDQLSLNQNLSENILYETIQTWDRWTASPTIISKKQWGGLSRKGYPAFSTIIDQSVAVGHSNASSCSDLSSCSEVVQKLQLEDRDKYGDVRYNFIFGGADLIFQGRSFDYSGAVTSFNLNVLFIGNYMTEQPPQSLIKAFENWLKFAVNVGKLTEDYNLYGQRQLIETDSPGDKLYEVLQNPPFDAYFDFNVTTAEPCTIGCKVTFS